MKTILVPLDGSFLAEQVLRYVRMLAPIVQARLDLLRVVADPEPDRIPAESIVAAYSVRAPLASQQAHRARSLALLAQNAERYLEPHAMLLHDAGLSVTVDVRCGPAAEVIVEAALEQHVALIALAIHGYTGVKRWALGSTTNNTCNVEHVLVTHAGQTRRLRIADDYSIGRQHRRCQHGRRRYTFGW